MSASLDREETIALSCLSESSLPVPFVQTNLKVQNHAGPALTSEALCEWRLCAGASVPEIASVTGHSLADVSAILDRHCLGERPALAEQAIHKLERKERRTRISNRVQQ